MAYNQKAWALVEKHLPTHYIGSTGPCCSICSLLYRVVVEAQGQIVDDPTLDGTDFAHTAWWRGYEYAFAAVCRGVNDILDGTAEPHGTASQPWQELRQRLYDIRAMLGIAERVIYSIPECFNRRQWYAIRGKYCKGVERLALDSAYCGKCGDSKPECKCKTQNYGEYMRKSLAERRNR